MAEGLTRYSVEGPFEVPCKKVGPGRRVDTEKLDKFWAKAAGVTDNYGCYVFAMRTSKTIVPWYVGATSKTFQKECFALHKLNICNEILLEKPKSKLVVLFVSRLSHKGKRGKRESAQIETWLITEAKQLNQNLKNKRKVPRERWGISGVIRSGPGKPSAAASEFRKMLEIGPP